MNSIIISPSLLSADFANLECDIKRVEAAGGDWLHVDVMDGHFVPNISIGIPVVKSIRKVTNLKLDVHLMISNPEKYVEEFIKAGADIVTFHYEATLENTENVINMVKSRGVKVGLSIKPNTPAEAIKKYIPMIDLVLVMTVEPGFGGQKFIEDCAKKLPLIKNLMNDKQYLQVDGGINAETGKYCVDLGANSLVAGSYVFNSDDVKKCINLLKY